MIQEFKFNDELEELYGIPASMVTIRCPPPVGDRQAHLRIAWDVVHEEDMAGGVFGWHKYDTEHIAPGPVLTKKAMQVIRRTVMLDTLMILRPEAEFMFLGRSIWQADRSFLRCYLSWELRQFYQKLQRLKLWALRKIYGPLYPYDREEE